MNEMLLQKRKKKRTVVFVCTGNTCRSPMARGLLLDYLEKNNMNHIDVKTAGVMTIAGLLPTQEAVQVMDSANINIRNHRSAPLTPEVLRKADLVLGMTPFHVQFALRMSPEARGKTFLLKEYTKSDLKNYQITDPMGATLEVYKRVFREIKLAIDRLVEMDAILGPLDQDLKHEKYIPPKPVKEAKPTAPAAKEQPAAAQKKAATAVAKGEKGKEKEKAAPAKKETKSAAPPAPAPAKAKDKSKKEEATPAPKAPAAKPAKQETKPAPKAEAKAAVKPAPAKQEKAPAKQEKPAAKAAAPAKTAAPAKKAAAPPAKKAAAKK